MTNNNKLRVCYMYSRGYGFRTEYIPVTNLEEAVDYVDKQSRLDLDINSTVTDNSFWLEEFDEKENEWVDWWDEDGMEWDEYYDENSRFEPI